MKKRAAIIGFGRIGKKLRQKLIVKGWDVVFVTTSKFLYTDDLENYKDSAENWQKYCADVNVAFVAVKEKDDGLNSLGLILKLREMNIKVILCAKAALANYQEELMPVMSGIRYSATVGGGSGIIHSLQERFFDDTQEVHVILNGTDNYALHDLAMGNPPGYIVEELLDLRYAEGDGTLSEIIKEEAELDATKKASILFNTCFKSPIILRAKNIKVGLTEEMVKRAMREARRRRFVVSFYRQDNFISEPTDILAFYHNIDGWVIKGGFVKMDNPYIARLCEATPWVHNGILTVDGEGDAYETSLHVGLGAGPATTASAMVRDAENS